MRPSRAGSPSEADARHQRDEDDGHHQHRQSTDENLADDMEQPADDPVLDEGLLGDGEVEEEAECRAQHQRQENAVAEFLVVDVKFAVVARLRRHGWPLPVCLPLRKHNRRANASPAISACATARLC